jgi:hypothetical protein
MVDVDCTRQSHADVNSGSEAELPRSRDGRGWIISCPTCGIHRTVGRVEILTGEWLRCPCCVAAVDGERNHSDGI